MVEDGEEEEVGDDASFPVLICLRVLVGLDMIHCSY